MVLFIPKERKQGEGRVGGVPEHVHDCIEAGAEVCVESGAGVAAGFLDRMYRQVRAATVDRLSFIDSMN
ncbi:MAG: NAD(P)(+) transhydrogenase (Re/Si-specific) subunit alpha, partial [Candidatus Sungbacteria bacterium]|nr:NAD(P)(+) transhydrogenase (Re/Si-specific) subunit alpha [Candidatus Sungbacteria bacterium]